MRKERGVAARGDARGGSGGVRAESRKPPRTETVVAGRRFVPRRIARRRLGGDDGGRAGVDVLVRLRVVVAGVAGVARGAWAGHPRGNPRGAIDEGEAARRARGDADVAHVAAHAAALVRTRGRDRGGGATGGEGGVGERGEAERLQQRLLGACRRGDGRRFLGGCGGIRGSVGDVVRVPCARGAGGDREARLALGKDARAHLVWKGAGEATSGGSAGRLAVEETKRFRIGEDRRV